MPLVPTTKMADAHKYSVLGNHWPGEPRDLRKTTSAFKFRPAFFGAGSKTRIFYKYVIFKHSFSFPPPPPLPPPPLSPPPTPPPLPPPPPPPPPPSPLPPLLPPPPPPPLPNFYCSADTVSSVWHSSYSPTEVKSKKMDKPRRHSFLQYTLTMRHFPASEKPTVSNHKKK